MNISKTILALYIYVRKFLKNILFYFFSENSKFLNIFVNIDIFFRKLGFLNNFLQGKFIYDDLFFYHDINDNSIASSLLINKTYEPELLDEIKKTLKTGSTFIDGGANIGFFSLVASKIIGPNGYVLAFEPTPATYRNLIKNIKENKINNIISINKGLSSSEKKTSFLITNNPEANSIISDMSINSTTKGEIIKINSTSIDVYCEKNNFLKIDLIKLDIEGQELEAIKGARKTLLRNKNIKIIFELNIANNKNGIEFAKEIFKVLKSLKFCNFEILLNPRVTINNLENIDEVNLLKKITNRHNVNILTSR